MKWLIRSTSPHLATLLLCTCSFVSSAKDSIIINYAHAHTEPRSLYVFELLDHALQVTTDEYGNYETEKKSLRLPNSRIRRLIDEGEAFNVAVAVTSKSWESNAIAIRVPIWRGALNYRLLLVHKDNQMAFSKVNTIEDLKVLYVGLRRSWATRELLSSLQFNVIDVYSNSALFDMLQQKRFDYIPRGVFEIYDDIDHKIGIDHNLIVEPNIALYIPAPAYFFVSKKAKRIAQRLETGLEVLVANGKLAQLFEQNYGEHIKRAAIHKRRIINIGNPLPSLGTPLERKELWFEWQ